MATIDVDEIALHWEAPRGFEADAAELALLIHGAGGSTRHWSRVVRALDPALRPLLLDLPGHGDSGGVLSRSADDAVHVVATFLEQLGVRRAIPVVGHSLGGFIAMALALAHPARVSSLGAIASSATMLIHPDFVRQAESGDWDDALARASVSAACDEEGIALIASEQRRMRVDGVSLLRPDEPLDLRAALGRIAVPVVVVVPSDDTILSPRRARLVASAVPRGRLVGIDGAGHYVPIEKPVEVARVIDEIVRGGAEGAA